ncbi:MAG: hypothetical protein J6P83_07385 [Bacteroidales bacterium]|nr:hypothetical protein [Bacteroidales bacterium]
MVDILHDGSAEFELDENGGILKWREYDNDGNLKDVTNFDNRYTYFSNGKLKLVAVYVFDQLGRLITLDDSGRIVEDVYYEGDGVWSEKSKYSYDSKGFFPRLKKPTLFQVVKEFGIIPVFMITKEMS